MGQSSERRKNPLLSHFKWLGIAGGEASDACGIASFRFVYARTNNIFISGIFHYFLSLWRIFLIIFNVLDVLDVASLIIFNYKQSLTRQFTSKSRISTFFRIRIHKLRLFFSASRVSTSNDTLTLKSRFSLSHEMIFFSKTSGAAKRGTKNIS